MANIEYNKTSREESWDIGQEQPEAMTIEEPVKDRTFQANVLKTTMCIWCQSLYRVNLACKWTNCI